MRSPTTAIVVSPYLSITIASPRIVVTPLLDWVWNIFKLHSEYVVQPRINNGFFITLSKTSLHQQRS